MEQINVVGDVSKAQEKRMRQQVCGSSPRAAGLCCGGHEHGKRGQQRLHQPRQQHDADKQHCWPRHAVGRVGRKANLRLGRHAQDQQQQRCRSCCQLATVPAGRAQLARADAQRAYSRATEASTGKGRNRGTVPCNVVECMQCPDRKRRGVAYKLIACRMRASVAARAASTPRDNAFRRGTNPR